MKNFLCKTEENHRWQISNILSAILRASSWFHLLASNASYAMISLAFSSLTVHCASVDPMSVHKNFTHLTNLSVCLAAFSTSPFIRRCKRYLCDLRLQSTNSTLIRCIIITFVYMYVHTYV